MSSEAAAATSLGGFIPIERMAFRWASDRRLVDREGEVLLLGDSVLWRIPDAFVPVARMLDEWRSERELLHDVPLPQLVPALAALRTFIGHGHVDQELRDRAGQPLVRVRQVRGTIVQDLRSTGDPVDISRFTVMRADGHELIVENPASHVVVTFPDSRAATVLMDFVAGVDPKLASRLEDGDIDALRAVLIEAGIALRSPLVGEPSEFDDPRLRPWKWHDVATHFRSRRGRHRYPAHATYHLAAQQPPEPGLKEAMSEHVIQLPLSDIDSLRESDMTLTAAIEDRFAGRDHDERPLTLEQISELLFRSSRVRWFSPKSEATMYDQTSRPYPTGGATYDLELYLTVDRCEGIESGLYHYDPDRHAPEFLDDLTPATHRMLDDASGATGGLVRPQVLITVASRFARISWKYEGIAYATTLRNVGVFYQTIWLVATAMGIACCPLGGGDTEAFARATGLDPLVESNVGEVSLGSLAPGGARGNRAEISRRGLWSERA